MRKSLRNYCSCIITVLIIVLCPTWGFSQNTHTILANGQSLIYNKKVYVDLRELESVISKNPLAWQEYHRFQRRRKVSNNMLIASGLVVGTSLIAFVADGDPQGEDWFTTGQAYGILGIGLIAPSLLVGGFISKALASSSKKKAINIYNTTDFRPNKFIQPKMELGLKISNNGLGLVLNF